MIRKLKNTAVLSMLIAAVSSAAFPVQAAAADLTVSIDQVDVSTVKLKNSNYEVPVFVRLEQNVNLNAIEFGISVDTRCRFDTVTRSEYSQIYGERIGIEMSAASIPDLDGVVWMTWARNSIYYKENSNILMFLVKVPENAQAGDVYELHYLSESPINAAKKHVWYNFGTNTDYALSGTVVSSDGYVRITEAQPGEDVLPGDANLDGVVNILDAITVNRAVLGKETLDDQQKAAADLNGDGIPDSIDSLMIMKIIVGISE
ncbi:MAG: dockerin type I repeat-containing protein [Oscillospiraceae bacterium]|nr:dockerin type I repeat-containing protein [Oscillospiraceae bacterium]